MNLVKMGELTGLRACLRAVLPQFVLPEMIAHAFLTSCFLLSFQFIALLINAPLVAYNVNKIMTNGCH